MKSTCKSCDKIQPEYFIGEKFKMEDIKQELMNLEFRHKKDIVAAEQRFNERFERMQVILKETQIQIDETQTIQKQTQLHLNHITKLTGISFEKFADIESRIEKAANALKP